MEALCQWDLAVAARVSGMRIREMAVERRRRPIMSREYQRDLRPPRRDWPFQGEAGRRLSLAAFLMLRSRDRARGRKATGSTMVQIP